MIHHPLRFAMALYLLSGWIYYLVSRLHCPTYVDDFVIILFLAWIFYEDFVCVQEYGNVRVVVYVNILSVPVPFLIYCLLSRYCYNFVTFVYHNFIAITYLIFYIALGVYFNVKMFR